MTVPHDGRSEARRAVLVKCADTMRFMDGDGTDASYAPTHVHVGVSPSTGRAVSTPVNDYTLHRINAARREDLGKMPLGMKLEHAAMDFTDPANQDVWRDVIASASPLSGVPYNLLKARGNYLRARQAAADGDVDAAFAGHVNSVGDAAMAALSLAPGLSATGKALQAAPGLIRGALTGRGAVNLVNRGVRMLTGGHALAPTGARAVRVADAVGKGATAAGVADLATGYTSQLPPSVRAPARAAIGVAATGSIPSRLYSSILQPLANWTGLSRQVGRYLGAEAASRVRAIPPVPVGTYAVSNPAASAVDYALAPSDLSAVARQTAERAKRMYGPAMEFARRAVTGDYAQPAVRVSGSSAPVVGKGFSSAFARGVTAGGVAPAYRQAIFDGVMPAALDAVGSHYGSAAAISPLLARLMLGASDGGRN